MYTFLLTLTVSIHVVAAKSTNCSLNIHHGVGIGQGHFKQYNNSSLDACCSHCTDEPNCISFVFNSDTTDCFLMANTKIGRTGPEFTSGCRSATCIPPTPPPSPPPPVCKNSECPNIVFFITDDQDYIIGGWDNMQKTKKLVAEQGVTMSNWFIHTPICAVSRGALQAGRYLQNIKSNNFPTPVSGFVGSGAQGHINYTGIVAPNNFGKFLYNRGYTNGLFGKWMNENEGSPGASGVEGMPPGWTRWFSGTGYENVTFTDSESPGYRYVSCPYGKTCAQSMGGGYSTSVLGNKTLEWISSLPRDNAFFAYVGVTAPHLPSSPPEWYADACNGTIAPRTPNFNYTSDKFHSGIRNQTPYTAANVEYVDNLAKRRCGTLLAVDDTVSDLIHGMETLGIMNRTYFFYTSDHGYNLGHHRLPDNKFNSYLHDLRIPMLVRGPGIPAGITLPNIGTQVDLGPTFLGLAGLDTPSIMDGRSIVPLLTDENAILPSTVKEHIMHEKETGSKPWRYKHLTVWYNHIPHYTVQGHCEDDWSNTYLAMYIEDNQTNATYKYAEFDPTGKQTGFASPNFYELFHLESDPYELYNVYDEVSEDLKTRLHNEIHEYYSCSSTTCP
eukprot:m.6236 g.6236  ORF g.6236 m.6236 type:complete len:612 (-) comp3504_c0_seq2:19-1854(-)